MSERGHLITCESINDYNYFVQNGFAGLYPIAVDSIKHPNPSRKALGSKIGTNWNVIADLKRIKIDDFIFLHTKGEGKIYGPFVAKSHFKEDLHMPTQFKSQNLKIDYWEQNYTHSFTYNNQYPYRISIEAIPDKTMDEGFPVMELFKLSSLGKINSLPPRFQYGDSPKIVKPLHDYEVNFILEILSQTNSTSQLTMNPNSLNSFIDITLDLTSHSEVLYREKILEAWLMENVTNNGNNSLEENNISTVFGNHEYFLNTVFTYYTNFIDVILYNRSDNPVSEICTNCQQFISKNRTDIKVIELKRDFVNSSNIDQIKKYYDWCLKKIANNRTNKISMCFIGPGFDSTLLNQTDIKCIKYTLHTTNPKLRLELLN